MKKKYALVQTVATYGEYLELTANHIIPLVVVVPRKKIESLPDYFMKLYNKSWVSSGLSSEPIYLVANGESLLKLTKKIKIEYMIFNNGEIKKIDKFYLVKDNKNIELEKRKKRLNKKNQLNQKCLLSLNESIWNENDYFDYFKDSLSDGAIKTYKKMNY